MPTLAHISDVHLAPLPHIAPRELLNKRITGYLNWRLNRAQHMHRETLSELISHLRIQNADFTAVTGDLVNLGLPKEFTRAAEWISHLGPRAKTCVIPGNHDAYVRGARANFDEAFSDYADGERLDNERYPFVRRAGDLAIIGCSSAIARPPFFADGLFDNAQALRLAQQLKILGDAGFFRVVLIHHPPNDEYARHRTKGLRGAALFRDVVREHGAELILHGHTHRSSINEIEGRDRSVPVVGVAAASADATAGEDPARYNLFHIEKRGNSWTCNLCEYGYRRIGDEIVKRLEMRIS